MFNRLEYQFFVNMFNVNGKYANKYLPGWRLKGITSIKHIEEWVNQHDKEEKADIKKHPSSIFSLSCSYKTSKINQQIEKHFTTHLLVHWYEYQQLLSLQKKNNHAIGISIIKDKYAHYHIFYLNKGQRTHSKTLYWFYIPPSKKNLMTELINAADMSHPESIEEALNQIVTTKNTLLITMPQPSSQKRGSCGISNTIKNIARVESLIDSIDIQDFRRYLHTDIASEIKMDDELFAEYVKQFKKTSYQQAWIGAFEFAELFETHSNKQEKISLGIIFYQGMYNRFQKTHFSGKYNHKITSEIDGITLFIKNCLEKKYYQSIILMLFHFAECKASKRIAKDIYAECIKELMSLETKINIEETFLDIFVLDLINDINDRKFISACARYEILNQLIELAENRLFQTIFVAINQANLIPLQTKLSIPINAQAFHDFTFLITLENDYADKKSLPIKPNAQGTSVTDFLHTAIELGKLKTLHYLIEEYKLAPTEVNSEGKTALDIAAECGHLAIYDYLIDHSLTCIDTSIKYATEYQQDNIIKLVIKNHLTKINKESFLLALTFKNIFDSISLESLLTIFKSDKEFIFNGIVFAAVFMDHCKTIQFFLEKNVITINQQNINNQQTLLHYAALFDRYTLFSFLLAYGSDLFAKDKLGRTPFRVAVDRANNTNSFKIIHYYLENHFAALSEEDLIACLTRTVAYDKFDLVDKLLSQHSFTHQTIQHAFCIAIQRGFVVIANLLMKFGAAINETNDEGYTAMHLAAITGGRTLSFAFENQGDIYAATYQGKSPIQVAGFESFKYLLTQVVNILHKQRSSRQPAWSLKKDCIIDLLEQLAEILKKNSSSPELREKINTWSSTHCKILYSVPAIQLSLQPLLDTLLTSSTNEEKPEIKSTQCLSIP